MEQFQELGKTDVPFFCARSIGQQDNGVWNWTTTLHRYLFFLPNYKSAEKNLWPKSTLQNLGGK